MKPARSAGGSLVGLASTKSFWDSLAQHYPTLGKRISTLIHNRGEAVLSFAQYWAKDKADLSALLGCEAGALLELSLGAGYSHSGGNTVAIVRCEGGTLIY